MEHPHAHGQAAGVTQGDGVGAVVLDDAVGLPAGPEQLLLVDGQREDVQQRLDGHTWRSRVECHDYFAMPEDKLTVSL